MTAAILAEGLVKHFDGVHAVDGVDLEVPSGSVLSLLGPNGAGKTTMVRMLATLLRPDAGRAWVAGHDIGARPDLVRESIGLTGQYTSVDTRISGRENLYLFARLLNYSRRRAWSRVEELLDQLGLTEAAGRLVSTYSGGMRRRLDLAASLIGAPRVLYLDEPTTGLDPRSRAGVWDTVRDLVAAGTTVLLTTQYMAEAEELADTVVVMAGGRVVASGSSMELRARIGGMVLRVSLGHGTAPEAAAAALRRAGLRPTNVDHESGVVSVSIARDGELNTAVRVIGMADLPIEGIETRVPSLDEVFLALTGSVPERGAERDKDKESDCDEPL
jgi:oleandomycin transport system ATP-binding protein